MVCCRVVLMQRAAVLSPSPPPTTSVFSLLQHPRHFFSPTVCMLPQQFDSGMLEERSSSLILRRGTWDSVLQLPSPPSRCKQRRRKRIRCLKSLLLRTPRSSSPSQRPASAPPRSPVLTSLEARHQHQTLDSRSLQAASRSEPTASRSQASPALSA